jgi:hypothetical protein
LEEDLWGDAGQKPLDSAVDQVVERFGECHHLAHPDFSEPTIARKTLKSVPGDPRLSEDPAWMLEDSDVEWNLVVGARTTGG